MNFYMILFNTNSAFQTYLFGHNLILLNIEIIKMNGKSPIEMIKMLILPIVLFGSKKLDFTNAVFVQNLQYGLVTVAVVVLSIHFLVYSKISASSNNSKKIWVPPKPKGSLPFGLGPAEEPLKVEDYEATTYRDHEIKLLKESVQSVAMSVGIALVMSFKFNIHMSLLMQSIMLPMGLIENLVLKKYILGLFMTEDASVKAYKELDAPPTQAMINAINAANSAAASGESADTTTTPAVTAASSSSSSSSSGSKVEEKPKTTTAASDLD